MEKTIRVSEPEEEHKPQRENNGGFQRREGGNYQPREGGNFQPREGGNFQRREGGNFQRREGGNFQPRENQGQNRPQRAPVQPAAPKTADQLFEEKLKAFMTESDSKLSGIKQYADHGKRRRRG